MPFKGIRRLLNLNIFNMLKIKNIFAFTLSAIIFLAAFQSCMQEDKSKRISPPATASETISNGNTVTINYSKPSLKGRIIGKSIAPFDTVWRAGANEATTFEIAKDAMIEGKALPKGKYSLYMIPGEKTWTVIFNKMWDQWGTEYNQSLDALRVQVAPAKANEFFEMLRYVIENDGTVFLLWGDLMVPFKVA